MNIVFNRQVLFEAISGVSRAVSQKNTLPSIEGILFSTEGDTVTMTCYNFELVITTKVTAEIKQQGSFVINARLLNDFVKMSEHDVVSVEVLDNMQAEITSGSAKISFGALPASDFPELPKPSTESSMSINGALLKEMIDMTLYAVSQDNQKPVHTGTKFVLENDSLSLVSVDGYRLAISKKPVKNDEEKSFVVPGRSLAEITRLINDDEQEVYINTARRYAVFYLAKYTVMTRLLEGGFLDYKRSIPEGYATRVLVPVKEMIAAVDKAALIITDRLRNPVKFIFGEDKTAISCTTALGSVYDERYFKTEGEDMTIGFNNRYITDALKTCGCDEVYFEITAPNAPLKVVPVEGDEFLHLVLPARITVE